MSEGAKMEHIEKKVWSAGVSPDGIFSFSSSGETPALHTSPPRSQIRLGGMGALHTYYFEVPQYFRLYIFQNTISYMVELGLRGRDIPAQGNALGNGTKM